MGFSGSLDEFRLLHDRAAQGTGPSAQEKALYDQAKDDLARVLLTMQRVPVRSHESPRDLLKVERSVYVDLCVRSCWSRGTTFEISRRQFSVRLTSTLPRGEWVDTRVYLGPDVTISSFAEVASTFVDKGYIRTVFAFAPLSASDEERLERFVFDTILRKDSVQLPRSA
jgi:hypothetical protein